MPLLKFSLREGRTPQQIRQLLDSAHAAVVQAFGIPERDRYQVVNVREHGQVIALDTGLGIDRSARLVIIEIVSDLEQGLKPGQQAIEDKIILRVCKQAAVKAGQVLSPEQMQGLIRQLERCQSPLTCPHGRPTMIHMSQERLEREFGRSGV